MSETVEITVDTLKELYGNVNVSQCPNEALSEASVVLESQESERVSATHEQDRPVQPTNPNL